MKASCKSKRQVSIYYGRLMKQLNCCTMMIMFDQIEPVRILVEGEGLSWLLEPGALKIRPLLPDACTTTAAGQRMDIADNSSQVK